MAETLLIYALPVFLLCMAAEWAWGRRRGRDTYRLADTLNSLSQGLLSQAVAALTPLAQTGLYAAVHARLALVSPTLWHGALSWGLAVLMYDFCDYWLHRVSHENSLFWAAHAVHHQSEHFNLSTALRQESLYSVMGAPFFLPMALLGVPTGQFAAAGMAVLLYQFWIHTEHIGRLGWLDRMFSTPSNHRVHHAVNPGYLDRNYGAILVLWDRLFGSFTPEAEPCIYGTVKPLASWNPLWAVGQSYAELGRRMRATPRLADKLRVIVKPPGWMPPGAAGAEVPAEARLAQPRFDPPAPRWARRAAVGLFLALAAGCGAWLAWSDDLGPLAHLAAAAVLAAGLWGVGALLSRPARGPATDGA
ncbi:sterol desaturase family protein [Pelomonas aquatica]|jgi:alkylglycerol monooxygenase|uniref:Sterol desaturase family protein n=1 Tax=Pelomonas aquatica TaxID=431058 RepID=A0A9X4R3I0_9BURK|nr:sterol desaturase family protein [Pelomonas aquatica]MCY4753277.1 sterol desaturase family protein [Pelomonas aquatica]MDG0861356.1 sterol desaturase family protein [Pelomonas aquatica]